jgi:hypothetical protein
MATSSSTAESVLGRFTYQILPLIVGIPTYASSQLLINDLKANSACIPLQQKNAEDATACYDPIILGIGN